MVKRPKSPKLEEDTRYFSVYQSYPLNANWLLEEDQKLCAQWVAECIGPQHLIAIYHKPRARGMILLEVSRLFQDHGALLGEHRWKEILKKPDRFEEESYSRVFHSFYAKGRDAQKDGWKEIPVMRTWFRNWEAGQDRFVNPYPDTHWCEVPTEDHTNKALCRPLPAETKAAPKVDKKPAVGSSKWVDQTVLTPQEIIAANSAAWRKPEAPKLDIPTAPESAKPSPMAEQAKLPTGPAPPSKWGKPIALKEFTAPEKKPTGPSKWGPVPSPIASAKSPLSETPPSGPVNAWSRPLKLAHTERYPSPRGGSKSPWDAASPLPPPSASASPAVQPWVLPASADQTSWKDKDKGKGKGKSRAFDEGGGSSSNQDTPPPPPASASEQSTRQTSEETSGSRTDKEFSSNRTEKGKGKDKGRDARPAVDWSGRPVANPNDWSTAFSSPGPAPTSPPGLQKPQQQKEKENGKGKGKGKGDKDASPYSKKKRDDMPPPPVPSKSKESKGKDKDKESKEHTTSDWAGGTAFDWATAVEESISSSGGFATNWKGEPIVEKEKENGTGGNDWEDPISRMEREMGFGGGGGGGKKGKGRGRGGEGRGGRGEFRGGRGEGRGGGGGGGGGGGRGEFRGGRGGEGRGRGDRGRGGGGGGGGRGRGRGWDERERERDNGYANRHSRSSSSRRPDEGVASERGRGGGGSDYSFARGRDKDWSSIDVGDGDSVWGSTANDNNKEKEKGKEEGEINDEDMDAGQKKDNDKDKPRESANDWSTAADDAWPGAGSRTSANNDKVKDWSMDVDDSWNSSSSSRPSSGKRKPETQFDQYGKPTYQNDSRKRANLSVGGSGRGAYDDGWSGGGRGRGERGGARGRGDRGGRGDGRDGGRGRGDGKGKGRGGGTEYIVKRPTSDWSTASGGDADWSKMPVSDWSADKQEDAEMGFPDPEVPSWAAESFVPPSSKGKEKTKEGEDEEMGWPEPELPDWAKEPFKPSEGKDKDQDEEVDWSQLPVKTWAHDSNEEKKDKGKEKEPETLEEMLERAGAAWEPLKVGDFTWDPAEELSKDDDGMNWGNIWEESQRAKAPELQCPTHGSTCKRGICRDLDRVYREQERNKSGKKFEGGSGSMSRKKSTESFESRSSKPAWADPFPIKYDENGNVKPRKKVRRGGKNKKKKDKDPMVMGRMRGFSDGEDDDPTHDDRPPKEQKTEPPSKRAEKRERRAAREAEEGGGSSRNEGEDGAEGSDRGQRPHHADITNDWGVDAGGEIKNDWGGEGWD